MRFYDLLKLTIRNFPACPGASSHDDFTFINSQTSTAIIVTEKTRVKYSEIAKQLQTSKMRVKLGFTRIIKAEQPHTVER